MNTFLVNITMLRKARNSGKEAIGSAPKEVSTIIHQINGNLFTIMLAFQSVPGKITHATTSNRMRRVATQYIPSIISTLKKNIAQSRKGIAMFSTDHLGDRTKKGFNLLDVVRHAVSLSGHGHENNSTDSNNIVVIRIRDNGIGLPESMNVFGKYETTKGAKGTGIGLSLAFDWITVVMGGAISAKNNTRGIGATFTIALPQSLAHSHANPVSYANSARWAVSVASHRSVDASIRGN